MLKLNVEDFAFIDYNCFNNEYSLRGTNSDVHTLIY